MYAYFTECYTYNTRWRLYLIMYTYITCIIFGILYFKECFLPLFLRLTDANIYIRTHIYSESEVYCMEICTSRYVHIVPSNPLPEHLI